MVLDAFDPALGHLRRRRPVEGGIDLDGVEVVRQVPQRVEALRLRRRIHLPRPVLVVPAGGPEAKLLLCGRRHGVILPDRRGVRPMSRIVGSMSLRTKPRSRTMRAWHPPDRCAWHSLPTRASRRWICPARWSSSPAPPAGCATRNAAIPDTRRWWWEASLGR